jgi:hypothetical protein
MSVLLIALLLPFGAAYASDKGTQPKTVKPDTTKSKAPSTKPQTGGWCEEDCGKNPKTGQANEKSKSQKQQTQK